MRRRMINRMRTEAEKQAQMTEKGGDSNVMQGKEGEGRRIEKAVMIDKITMPVTKKRGRPKRIP